MFRNEDKGLIIRTPPDSRPMTSVERGSSDRAGKLFLSFVAVATGRKKAEVSDDQCFVCTFEDTF